MSRYRSYLDIAKQIIEGYKGETPFAIHLKNFFSGKKKFGSTDRKTISALCYNFFRAGNLLDGDIETRIVKSFFLLTEAPHPFLEEMDTGLNGLSSCSLSEKLALLKADEENLFPFLSELSPGIDRSKFCRSMLHQPALFLRIRPGKENIVVRKLTEAGLAFEKPDENSVLLANGTKLDGIIAINRNAVIQDLCSQHTLDFLEEDLFSRFPVDVWDCCAASGGKSILAFDKLGQNLRLTVTDIRSGILKNLKLRLAEAGVPVFHSAVKDLTTPVTMPGKYNVILCDAPCTGSGTWSRTPELLHQFKKEKIKEYSELQRKIIKNALPHLDAGGVFVYITCSVFSQENEAQVNYLLQQHPQIKLLHQGYVKGYEKRADTLFTSSFKLSH